MSVFEHFLGGRRLTEQLLSRHEVARQIRDVAVRMFDFGVLGSDSFLPEERTSSTVKIPILLRYSPNTMAHYQTLAGVLRSPREFRITVNRCQRRGCEESNESQGDVIYQEGNPWFADEYRFAHHLTSPYLNAWMAVLDGREKGKPFLDVCLLNWHDIRWMVTYAYFEWEPFNQGDMQYLEGNYPKVKRWMGFFAGEANPERYGLLNFGLSPQPLVGEQFLQGYWPRTKPYLRLTGSQKIGPFRVTNFYFDAVTMAQDLGKHNPRGPQEIYGENDLLIYTLTKEGNREFSIVDLGKTQIGNLIYYMYSTSEQPLVKEQVAQRVAVPQLVLESVMSK